MAAITTVLGLMAGVVGLGSAIASAAKASFCESGVSPYSLTAAQRSECGDRATPLTRVEPMPNGGQAYIYDNTAEESQTVFPVPPASFDAATASAQELESYDIPPRPELGTPGFAHWQAAAGQLRIEAPPPAIFSVPLHFTSEASNSHWSGYINDAKSQVFKQAAAWFTEPLNDTTECSKAAAVTWVGLGGWNSQQLAQDGTSVGEDGLGEGEFWWEILPEYPSVLPMSKYYEEGGHPPPGELAYAEVKELSNTEFQFYVETEFKGHGFTTKTKKNGYDGSSADYIVERPEMSGTGSYFALKNFGEVTFEPRTNGKAIATYGHKSVEMKATGTGETGDLLAQPGELSSSDLFTDYHYNCK
jgi:hypothetical protein